MLVLVSGHRSRVWLRWQLELAGESHRLVIARSPSTGVSCNVLDISSSTRDFGWSASTSLADGLRTLLGEKERGHDAS